MSDLVKVKCCCGTSPERLVDEVEVNGFVANRLAATPMAHGQGTVASWLNPQEMRADDTLNPTDIERFKTPHAVIVSRDGCAEERIDSWPAGAKYQSERDLWRDMYGRLSVEYRTSRRVSLTQVYYGIPELTVGGDRVRVQQCVELLAVNS